MHATLLFIATNLFVHAQTQAPAANRDPERAPVVTSDVALFWKAYDSWSRSGAQPDRLASVLQSGYLDVASEGVRDFTADRIISAKALAGRILEDRAYYERVRPNTEEAASMAPQIREVYRKFQKLYPEAAFPALYIVIGCRNSGGMSSPRALILGAEMFFGEGARLKFEDLIPMVAHELVHFQQNTDPSKAQRARSAPPGSQEHACVSWRGRAPFCACSSKARTGRGGPQHVEELVCRG